MLSEKEYIQEAPARPRWRWSATVVLLIVNAIVWLVEFWGYHKHEPILDKYFDYFALSVDGLKHGYVWQLLTYQFMHSASGPWHLLFNSWAIYVFGNPVELTLGKKRMLQLYFLSGIAGGLLQMLGMGLLPVLFGEGATVGASACAFGLIAAFAVLYPGQRLYLLLFLIIPLKIRATTLLWISVVTSIFGIFFPLVRAFLPFLSIADDLFLNIGHLAHLGGIITGYMFARRLINRLIRMQAKNPPPIYADTVKSSLNINPAPD